MDGKKQKNSKVNTGNINEWLKSRDQRKIVLGEIISRKDKELEELKKKNGAFSKIIRQEAAKEAAYKIKAWYCKRLAKTSSYFGIDNENPSIWNVENENVKLKDTIKEVSKKTLTFYKNRKYNGDVRLVYENLLFTGLSTTNFKRCVKLPLEKLSKAIVYRSPKVLFTNVSWCKKSRPKKCRHKITWQ